MGLCLQVGMLADLRRHDPEGAVEFERELAAVGRLLESAGLPRFEEPEVFDADLAPWSVDLFGYDSLLALRRVAAYLAAGRKLPRTASDDPDEDPLVRRYYRGRSLLRRILQGRREKRLQRRFDHLMHHADHEGWYVPVRFDGVLEGRDPDLPGGGLLGSSVALMGELDALASYLQIPPYLEAGSDELLDAAVNPDSGNTVWSRHGLESHACVTLREACRRSLAAGSVLVFC